MRYNRYQGSGKLSGILYLHCIMDDHTLHSLEQYLNMLEKLCGKNPLHNIICITTHWDQLEDGNDSGIKKEEKLHNNYWKPLLDGGSQML